MLYSCVTGMNFKDWKNLNAKGRLFHARLYAPHRAPAKGVRRESDEDPVERGRRTSRHQAERLTLPPGRGT